MELRMGRVVMLFVWGVLCVGLAGAPMDGKAFLNHSGSIKLIEKHGLLKKSLRVKHANGKVYTFAWKNVRYINLKGIAFRGPEGVITIPFQDINRNLLEVFGIDVEEMKTRLENEGEVFPPYFPAFGDGVGWTKSKANARITRIEKGRVRSGAGDETSIEVKITIPAQREKFWLTAYVAANAYIDGEPVVLQGTFSSKGRWSRRKFYIESHVHFPKVDKIVGISVILFDKDSLLLDTKTKGKFKPMKGTLPIVGKTGNGHISQSY